MIRRIRRHGQKLSSGDGRFWREVDIRNIDDARLVPEAVAISSAPHYPLKRVGSARGDAAIVTPSLYLQFWGATEVAKYTEEDAQL
jgi:hypothetical protein